MSTIAATNLLTGRQGDHKHSFAQLGDIGYIVNGHDSNQVYNLRTGSTYALGMAAPAAAGTTHTTAAGNLTGTFKYRIRWRDSTIPSMSLPGPEFTVTAAAVAVTINQPASPPARATHWVIERSTNNGATFYPLNLHSSATDGTAIGTTTYVDNADYTDIVLAERKVILSNQGQPAKCRWAAVNGAIAFLGGARIHRPTCTVTQTSPNVSSSDGDFTADMVGEDFAVAGDTDGKTYRILTYTDANNIVLASNYTGSTGTKACTITGKRNRVYWCEPRQPEHFGAQIVGGLQNELLVGDSGEPVVGGVGLGPAGFLYCCENRLYFHSYDTKPNLASGGRVIPIQTRRGIVGPKAVIFVDGLVYGIDVRGIWRMAPGGSPEEMGLPIGAEWKVNNLNFAQADNWHIGYCPYYRHVIFYVGEGSDTYPKKAYIWSTDAQDWVGTLVYDLGVTCTVTGAELPDGNGAPRLNYWLENSGTAGSFCYVYGIGNALGANPTFVNQTGTATAGGAATLTNGSAAWPTTGDKLKGLACTLVRAADGSEETKIIQDNTATVLTMTANWTGSQPANGDTYRIAGIPFKYRSGRLNMGLPDQKKIFKEVWVWLKFDANAQNFFMRSYFDGSATAYSDYQALDEDGVTIAAATAKITLKPSVTGQHRLRIPLNHKEAVDVQLEFYMDNPGVAPEIFAIEVKYEEEPRENKTRK